MVCITVNGKGIEVDLAAKSVARLTKALEPFWAVGTEHDFVVTQRQRGTRRQRDVGRGYDLDELRQWAANNGTKLPSRGRIPAAIVKQFLTS